MRGRPQPSAPPVRTYAGLGLNAAPGTPSPSSSIVASGIPTQGIAVSGLATPWISNSQLPGFAPRDGGEDDIELDSLPSLHDADDPDVPIHYEGGDDFCSICQSLFDGGERVARLVCRHVFHAECLDRLHAHARRRGDTAIPECVNCRGGGRIIATWMWIAVAPEPTPTPVAIGTPPSPGWRYFTPATSEPNSRGHSPAFAVWSGPWGPTQTPTSSYHASTGMGPG